MARSCRAPKTRIVAPPVRSLFSVFLSLILACSLAPGVAWAEAADASTAIESSPAQKPSPNAGKTEEVVGFAATPAAQSDDTPAQDENGVYQLATVDEVLWFFKSAPSSASAKLCGDFDLRGTSLAPKTGTFSGTFDGDGHTLTVELTLPSGDKKGLFTTNTGTIENLTIAGSVVTKGSSSSGYCQASLVGENKNGTVRNCTNMANVSGTANYIGGLVASNNGGAIESCTNQGSVTTTASYYGYAGGIVGYDTNGSKSSYANCVNVGTITANKSKKAGGIIGYAYSTYSGRTTLKNCQTTKTLSPVPTNSSLSYWLTGYGYGGYPTCTNCSFYQVPVATLELTGVTETGVTLRARALGATGMEASGTVFTWEAADSVDGPFEAIASAGTGATFAIPQNDTLVGKYVRASVAADQNSSATSDVIGPIVKSDTLLVTEAKDSLTISTDDITSDNIQSIGTLALPAEGLNKATISWASNNEAVIGADGSLALPETASAVTVRLTATLRVGSATATKTFDIKVYPVTNPVASVQVTDANGAFPTDQLITGTKLTAAALGKNGKAATNVTYQWQYAESSEAAAADNWEDISGAASVTWTVPNNYVAANPDGWKGRVVRVVAAGDEESSATSGASGAVAFSDKLCAETDFKLIQDYYNTTYAHIYKPCDLAFPATGANGSAITWESRNESLITPEGLVTLPLDKDTSVEVTATVKKGENEYTYTGRLTLHPIPVALTGVTVEGIAESGQTLTAVPQGAEGKLPTNVKYQWQYSADGTNWSNINYATNPTYSTSYSTYGNKYLRAAVTGVDGQGQPVTLCSEPVFYVYLSSSEPTRIDVAGTCTLNEALTATAMSGTYYPYEIKANEVAWQWLVSATGEEGTFLPIPGATSNTYTPDLPLRGQYLQVSARTQKGTYVHTVGQVGPVSLDSDEARVLQALQLLRDASANGWTLAPESPRDTNLATLVQAKLTSAAATAGVDLTDVSLSLQAATPVRNGSFASLSYADDETNGAIDYFFYNPSVTEPTALTRPDGFGSSFDVTFKLTCGDAAASWSPSQPVTLGWDQNRIQSDILKPAAQAVGATMFTEGDTASTVTHNLNLPVSSNAVDGVLVDPSLATAITSPFVTATWKVTGYDNYYVSDDGVINDRPANDRDIILTGTFTFNDGGLTNATTTSFTSTYRFTLKAYDWEPGLSDQELLQRKIDQRYQLWNPARTKALTEIGQTEVTVTDDFVVPTSTQLKLPGFGVNDKYAFSVESGNDELLSVNSYRVNVFQPLDGEAATTTLTVKVYERERPSVCATKVYHVTVAPVSRQSIEDEIALMEEAKARYFEAIARGQSADAVTENLDYFFKVSRGTDGGLVWSRTNAEASAIVGGIVPQLVTNSAVPDDNQYFESSDKRVVAHQNLLVTRPAYDRTITVRSCLSSEKFAGYYERYQNDPTWGPLLAQLYRQPVEATFVVKGTEGSVDPSGGEETAVRTVTASITGVTEHEVGETFSPQAWIPTATLELDAEETWSAWDCFSRLLSAHGMGASTQDGWSPFSITNQAGRTLAATSDSPQSYWAFYVNGTYADQYPDDYEVADGDVIELRYLDRTGERVPADAPETNADAAHPDLALSWEGFTEHASLIAQGALPESVDATPQLGADIEEAFAPLELGTEISPLRALRATAFSGRSLSVSHTSDPLVIGGKTFLVSGSEGRLATLSVITSDGTKSATKRLAGAIDSTCRVAYGDGIVVIPLADGAVQALSASNLETLWYVPASLEGAQSLSSPTVANGLVYLATAEKLDSAGVSHQGTVRAFDLHTGSLRGAIVNQRAGFYWAGGAFVGGAYVIGDDTGVVHAYRPDLSLEISSLALGSSPLRSTLVVGASSGATRSCYLVSRDGMLHQFSVDRSGQLRRGPSLAFADSSTSTPAVVGSTAYVGGKLGVRGVLAVIDLDRFAVAQRITQADGSALPADVKSHPLAVRNGSGTAVYFTSNDAVGCLYGYQTGNAQATRLYQPAASHQNYTMASPYLNASGHIGYTNDSGLLFMLKKKASALEPIPSTPEQPGAPEEPDIPGDSKTDTPGDTTPGDPQIPDADQPSTPGEDGTLPIRPGATNPTDIPGAAASEHPGGSTSLGTPSASKQISAMNRDAFLTSLLWGSPRPFATRLLDEKALTGSDSPAIRAGTTLAPQPGAASEIAIAENTTPLGSNAPESDRERALIMLILLAILGCGSTLSIVRARRDKASERTCR